ncbi:hypothetical protein EUGRSUZ_H00698 [Eucalyptus grandis]|uniref:Uncharacterized protein n=2 Tax=Eucalyptus grandis TaxID=71139 RepID=A0ACC3JMI5_EUCGR|nr:hypothetical protein EUGRSUZ_H00698 [Eucalyptus grandis]
MLQFSKRLVSKGLKATLALTVHIAKSMHADPSSSIDLETISDGHDLGGLAEAKSIQDYLTCFQTVGSRGLAELIHKLDRSGQPVDTVIYDGFLPWALDVAKQCDKLGVVFFTQTCAVNNIYYHVQRGLLPLPLSGGSVEVPGLPPLEPSEMPSFVCKLGTYPAFYDLVINQFMNVDEADFVLCDTFYELEKEVVDWMSANFIAELDPSQFSELAHGLALAGHPFLWVVRSSEQHKLPRDPMDSIPSKEALILPWCDQLEILTNDSIGCFVTHCGLNSVIEAICLGVPMVAMPQWTDQGTNAKFVEDVWRVGVRAKADEAGLVRREEVERRVREVLGGGERGREMADSARRWMAAAKASISEGGSSDRNIDDFVAKLATHSSVE